MAAIAEYSHLPFFPWEKLSESILWKVDEYKTIIMNYFVDIFVKSIYSISCCESHIYNCGNWPTLDLLFTEFSHVLGCGGVAVLRYSRERLIGKIGYDY